jgi:hypothetical protein
MANVDRATRQAWSANPHKWVDLVVHVSGDVSERAAALESRGCKVTRTFRLTRTLGIRCTGRMALELLEQPWVSKVEPDRPVRALGR